MAVSLCRGCKRTFAGLTTFDAHQRPIKKRPFVKCLDPKGLGLVLKDGKWSSGESVDISGVAYVPAAERPDADYIVECSDCGKEFMRPRTRGRPPKKCPDCKAKS